MNFPIVPSIIPLRDEALAATPLPANARIPLAFCPSVPNAKVALLSVDLVCTDTLGVDGSNVILVDTIKKWDQSASSGAGADGSALFTGGAGAAGDLLTARLDLKVVDHLFSGYEVLDPGDHVDAILATTTPDTAGKGYYFLVMTRLLEYNGQI